MATEAVPFDWTPLQVLFRDVIGTSALIDRRSVAPPDTAIRLLGDKLMVTGSKNTPLLHQRGPCYFWELLPFAW